MAFQNLNALNSSQNKQGFPKPCLSRPAQPNLAHLLETFCPSAVLWKTFLLPKTSSFE